MRRCSVARQISPVGLWARRSLRTSPRSRPRAVKQLNNAELLQIVQEGRQTAPTPAPESADVLTEEVDELPQESPRLYTHSPLPRSPLEEPRLVAARTRHKAEKPPPSKERSPFQTKLEKNPYARALSTPPRLCILTSVRLPSYFQIPFGIAKHPKTGAPWHLPRLSELGSGSEANSTPPTPSSSSPESEKEAESKVAARTASGTYLVASRDTLAHISQLKRIAYRRIMPYRWKEDPILRASDIVWREDMDTVVLEMLRRNVAKDLKYLASRPAAYIAACKSHDNISDHTQISAVLSLAPDAAVSSREASSDTPASSGAQGLPPYAMRRYKDCYIPYYNLFTLLGPTHLQSLRDSKPDHFGGQIAVIKAKRRTVRLQLALWKLMGYLAPSIGEIAESDAEDEE